MDAPDEAAEPLQVLLVDDQELFRRGLRLVLSAEPGMVIEEAHDGPSGVEAAARSAPDVVLLDVRMPGMSGPQAAAAIKAVAPSARIVMLTASDEEADLFDSVRNGAAGYLLKDSSVDQVSDAVRKVATGQSLISPPMATRLLEEFRQMASREGEPARATHLSDRELEVLRLVAMGRNNREIAGELFISENTVKNHVRNILEKLQLRSRVEAATYAVRERLLDP
ncbi:DNA-binding NarL/FixJ family response regulator [Mumia flava]|uniref:DNA-binding NarL/FixJ family response regulator n=1 Tax=Mumia flava TaxID=1348852 RepID=A0A0B2BI77_9ACTN|nr:response regulator transcription factor [Mumia flava]PJJ58544.1 DNA-binding NarL/FixJ family response regulator [Mumia flava]